MVCLTDEDSVIYCAEQDHCRRFPGPASADLRGGPRRNFQIFHPLDFLAELTEHISEKGEPLIRYFGWYSHRKRGIRAKSESATPTSDKPHIDRSALDAEKSARGRPRAGSVSTWAMLIKRVYEVDPLECPKCGGAMKIISFITESAIIYQILKHLDLWKQKPSRDPPIRESPAEKREIVYEPFDDGWPVYDEPTVMIN